MFIPGGSTFEKTSVVQCPAVLTNINTIVNHTSESRYHAFIAEEACVVEARGYMRSS